MLDDSKSSKISVKVVNEKNYFMADPVSATFYFFDVNSGQPVKNNERVFIDYISNVKLDPFISSDILDMWEIAKALFCYGYLYYPFFSLALEQALKTLEVAITFKFDVLGGSEIVKNNRPVGLEKKINFIYSKGKISDGEKEVLHSLRMMRNMSFHPKYQQITGPYFIDVIKRIADIINRIWSN